jgi:hypothetical protein
MVTLFANMLKAHYEHVMGSLVQQFTNIIVVANRIYQGVRGCRISVPIEKKCSEGKKKQVDHVKVAIRVQSYHTLSLSS